MPQNKISLIDTIKLCYNVGFRGQSLITAVCIAIAESGLDAWIVGDIELQNEKWGDSFGLFQIRALNNYSNYSYPDNLRAAEKLTDAKFNCEAAFAISKKGTDWHLWATYNSGAYTKNIIAVSQAVETVLKTATTPTTGKILIGVLVGYVILKKIK